MNDFFLDIKRLKSMPGYRGLVWFSLDQSFWVLLCYRFSRCIDNKIFLLLSRVILEKPLEFLTKNYFPFSCKIGPGLVIWHAHGLVLNGKSVIGKNCTIYSRVCIGNRWPGDGTPTIGDNVTIGTGACILGPVKIKSNSLVKCNSVVTPKDMSGVISAHD